MKENKVVFWTNIVFLTLIVVATIIFMTGVLSPYIIKTLDSVLFVLCGVVNLIFLYKYKKEESIYKAFILLAGLSFACVGDIVLISNFVLGAIFFGVGHIFFVIFFYSLNGFNYKDILISLGIFIVCLLLIFLLPVFDFGNFLLVVIFYALIISFMLGKAASNYINTKLPCNLILFIGAGLFFFSDFMLVFDRFTNLGEVFGLLCLATYYLAEFLLAMSIYNVSYDNTRAAKMPTKE